MTSATFESLRVLKQAEELADSIWKAASRWDGYARDTVGKQLIRAVNSIGANVAEAYGRFHYGAKLNFLYFARGSLFETKYWLNRCQTRGLLPGEATATLVASLTDLARQLNSFASSLKQLRSDGSRASQAVREPGLEYDLAGQSISATDLFSPEELASLSHSTPLTTYQ